MDFVKSAVKVDSTVTVVSETQNALVQTQEQDWFILKDALKWKREIVKAS